jgi:hypothetical protein
MMRMRAAVAGAAMMMAGSAAAADCGSHTDVAAGERLADVAARCGVALEALRTANPTVDDNPAVGTQVAIPVAGESDGGTLMGRAADLLRDAGTQIEQAARDAGESVRDYLASDPDISRDLRQFGERYGLPGFAQSAAIVVTPAAPKPGEEITVAANGLKSGAEAEIRIGPSVDSAVTVATVTADTFGRLEAKLQVPAAFTAETMVVVVDTPNVLLRSDPIAVAGGG